MPLSVVMDSLNDLSEDIKALYTERSGQFYLTGIAGVKAQEDVDRISEGLRKEREDHKETKAALRAFDGLEAEQVRKDLARLPELELRVKNDPEKFEERLEELVAARLATSTGPLELELKNLKTENTDLQARVEKADKAERQRQISDAALTAAREQKVQDVAESDVLLFSQSVLTLTDDGRVVVGPNSLGIPEGLEPKDMLSEMKAKKPHWWPPTIGGDARGGAGGGGGSNPFSNENWNLTEQGRVFQENPERASTLAKAAGTTVGGARPVPKK